MKLLIFVTFIFISLIAINSVSLAVSIKYGFLPEMNHYQTDTCNVTECSYIEQTCTSYGKFGKTTYQCNLISLILSLNDTSVYYPYSSYDWFRYDICSYPKLNCYYDDRNITTLSITKLPAPPVVAAIVIISLFIPIVIISYIVFLIWYFL